MDGRPPSPGDSPAFVAPASRFDSDLESALLAGLEDAPGSERLTPETAGSGAPDPADRPAGGELESVPSSGRPDHPANDDAALAAALADRSASNPPAEPDIESALLDGLEEASGAEEDAGGVDNPRPPGEPDLEATLLEGLADGSEPDEIAVDDERSDPAGEPPEEPLDLPPPSGLDAVQEESAEPEAAAGPEPAHRDEAHAVAGSEPGALAFAADADTESVLREGLADLADPQVWPGGLRTAIDVLSGGHAARIIFVDLDGTPYPAGAIHELAAVCEVGTAVVALGTDASARFSRGILLAGVNDYLVKPVTAASVREAAARAASPNPHEAKGGWSVGFAGTGGSGATTVAAATALVAADRGRYVSVLDLDRTFPALSFLLDVEPAAGLVELLSTAARASLHPEMVDGMRAERSDRIAVYGYPWNAPTPPLAPVWAVCELLVELQRRSHLVLIDGLDDPATRLALLALADARVLVVEPTAEGAARTAHLLERFGPMFEEEWPFLLVQNHTRDFKPREGAAALAGAGLASPADVVVPFEPSLPAIADRGWPGGRIPKSLHESLDHLADRVLAGEKADAPALA